MSISMMVYSLQKQYDNHRTCIEVAAKIGLKGGKQGAVNDLKVVQAEILEDLQFVTSG